MISSKIDGIFSKIDGIFSKIGKPLMSHQKVGINWMIKQEDSGYGGILADDPGVGKTYQVLSLLLTEPSDSITLIIVPSCLITQWSEILYQLFERRQVLVFHGPDRPRYANKLPRHWKVILTTYSIVMRDFNQIDSIYYRRIIVDEVHKMKRGRSKTSETLKKLHAEIRWGLTGTPVQNNEDEILNLFRFILNSDQLRTCELPSLMSDFLLRRNLDVVLGDKCPKLEESTLLIDFASKEERDFYQRISQDVNSEYRSLLVKGQDEKSTASSSFELLTRLRQATQHPQLVYDGWKRKAKREKTEITVGSWTAISSKHLKLLELLKEHPSEVALCFCHFVGEMKILHQLLCQNGFTTDLYHGGLIISERNRIINKLNNNPPAVLLVQICSGGVGLNLQSASRVYLMSPDWNPTNEIQAIARAHRIGQIRCVHVKRLLLSDRSVESIDSRIVEIQQRKRCLMSELLNEPEYQGLTSADYDLLLR